MDDAAHPSPSPAERPCIGVCRYEDATEWCLGCGMTKREKKAWKRAPEYRPAILSNLPARMGALAAAGQPVGPGKKARDR